MIEEDNSSMKAKENYLESNFLAWKPRKTNKAMDALEWQLLSSDLWLL